MTSASVLTPPPVLLVDIENLTHRAYHGVAAHARNSPSVWKIRQVLQSRLYNLQSQHPDSPVIIAAELNRSFRRNLYAHYKARRYEKSEVLMTALHEHLEWCRELGFAVLASPGYEADDVLATLASGLKARHQPHVVVSGDKDLFACLSESCQLLIPENGQRWTTLQSEDVVRNFGVNPERWSLYKTLRGDKQDNYAGVPGTTQQEAALICSYHSTSQDLWDALHTLPEELAPFQARLIDFGPERLRQQWTLAHLVQNAPLVHLANCDDDQRQRSRTPTPQLTPEVTPEVTPQVTSQPGICAAD